jgi:Fic family protein
VASPSPLLCAPADKPQLEARNGVRQLDYISYLVTERRVEDIRESFVLDFHRIAVEDIYPCGGQYRDALRRVTISGSNHQVPHESLVPGFVRDLVDRLNVDRQSVSPLDRAAYALWRFNWIHPFAGGNGRSARALSYLVLCLDMGLVPPGLPQLPTLIYDHRADYVAALRAADASERDRGNPDLSGMKALIEDAITRQLASAINRLGQTARD